MKRFFKLFMAVAAVAGVIACTTDATEDLGVNLNGGQTTLTLSLDDTRTQLGEKADGVYALTWAENDAISVNGSVSNALAEDEAGATRATFTFKNGFGENPTSYFIAYPATSTNNQVVFAAEQTHTSNTTFGNGAAVMYGYTTDLSNVTLKHLTGVLKIGVVSNNGEILKSVRISTVDRKPIAGTFSVDAEGKLTPVNGATSDVITYTFSEGVDLTAEPTYIHVAVPAGVYGELYVTLEAETEKAMDDIGMNIQKTTAYSYKTVITDSTKPVNAGSVREFSTPIPYSAVDSNSQFIIKDYNSLEIFAEAVKEATETAPITKNAVFVADVEIPAAGWTSVDAQYYTGTINGNGYAIKGLNAPLFSNLGAAVKGLHLTDVEINTTTTIPNFGTLANTYYGSSISNCSTEGTVTLKITKDAATFVGGFVGQTKKAATLSNLVNDVDITTSGEFLQLSLGGIVGSIGSSGNAVATTATNLTNKGDLIVKDTKFACSSHSTNNNFGGIVGYAYGTFTASDLTNEGAIQITNTTKPTTAEKGKINLGGILGLNGETITAENWHNKGAILLQNIHLNASYYNIGGIISYNSKVSSFTNLTNDGNITFSNATLTRTDAHLDVGGVFGTATNTTNLDGNITNTGDILCYDITKKGTTNPGFGGIIGLSAPGTGDVRFVFKDTAVLNNSGDVKVYGGTYYGSFGMAGIVGCNKALNIKNATNTGDMISATTLDGTKIAFVGGISGGNWDIKISNSKSYCNLAAFTWDGKASTAPTDAGSKKQVGMITSNDKYSAGDISNCQMGGGWFKSATVVTDEDGSLDLAVTYDAITHENFFQYMCGLNGPTSDPGVSVCKYWDGKEE